MATSTKKSVMQTFIWEGKDRKGKLSKGSLTAQSTTMAKAQLRKQGIIPKRIKKKSKPLFGAKAGKITAGDIAVFSRQLTTMMTAGVPLVQSFDIVAQGQSNKAMQELIFGIKADVETGSTMSSALSKYPAHFDDLFCSLVYAGEISGTLETLLNEISIYKEKTESLKNKIKKAMFYPIAVLIIAFIVTAILLMFVVPQFEALFSGMGSDLPAFTKMVVNLSEFMQEWWYLIFGGIGGTVFGLIHLKKTSKAFADGLDRVVLKLPVVGDIIDKAATARFARTLSTLQTAGVPLVEAMDSVADAAGNSVYRKAILKMRDDTSTGRRLQESMKETGVFSTMAVQMVAIGEESGALGTMLSKVADYYEEEVDNAVDGLTSLMEPMIMAFLGVVVGGLVVAMYLPIFKMGDAF